MRKPLVIANWKMQGSRPRNASLVANVRRGLGELALPVDIVLCPSFVYLAEVAVLLEGSPLRLGAQDLSEREAGAHTGDIAGEMLKELGCEFVIVGHSERRAEHGETDEQVARKCVRAKAAGLEPVLCVGETLAQREAGETSAVVVRQVDAVLKVWPDVQPLVIAYEPVWAIGTGKTATSAQVQEVHALIRQRLGSRGAKSRILYGGSVKADNAAALFAQPDVDGGLVGGASLEAESFVAICRAATR